MREKVIDIYPSNQKINNKKKSCVVRKKEGCKSRFFVPGIILFFLLSGYFYYISFKTEVLIYPVTESFQLDENVLIRTTGSISEKEIRGVVLSERVSDRREFEIEGRRLLERKTKGEIRVCQDYRDSKITLVSGTRFISDDGKLFFATSSLVLPPRQENDGCATVEVEAAEAGEGYNISEDSKFALPGLQGSAMYGSVKGVSFKVNQEGVLKEVPYLDDETMERVETQMKEDLFLKGKEILAKNYKEDYLIDADAQYSIDVVERDLVEKDEESFYFNLDVRVKVMAIDKEDMNNFIASFLPENSVWREDTKDFKISFMRINFEEGEVEALVEFRGDVYQKIDKEGLSREIVGLDFEKAEGVIKESFNVGDVEVYAKPFGFSKVAGSSSRVEIKLQFDKN